MSWIIFSCIAVSTGVIGLAVAVNVYIRHLKRKLSDYEYDLGNLHSDYFKACKTVAEMHKAAVGSVTGPNRGVVEDVADMKTRLDEALNELERIRNNFANGITPVPTNKTTFMPKAATAWADEFIRLHGNEPASFDLVHGWFYHALLLGYETAERHYSLTNTALTRS